MELFLMLVIHSLSDRGIVLDAGESFTERQWNWK